jgi:hypothetical protein
MRHFAGSARCNAAGFLHTRSLPLGKFIGLIKTISQILNRGRPRPLIQSFMLVKRNTGLKSAAKTKTGDAKPRAKHHPKKTHPETAKPAQPDDVSNGPSVLSAALTENSISREEIARLAYASWELRGRPVGSAEYDWIKAEEELRSRQANPLGSKHTG